MYSSNAFARSEMDYRASRIREGVVGSRRGRRRGRARRPAEATESAR